MLAVRPTSIVLVAVDARELRRVAGCMAILTLIDPVVWDREETIVVEAGRPPGIGRVTVVASRREPALRVIRIGR